MSDEATRAHDTGGPHALFAGGGTGGHVFPAFAVAEELIQRGWRVSFLGAATGIEARLVGGRGLPFHPLDARPLVGQGVLGKVRALATLAGSALAARRLVRRQNAAVVVGTGGYVSAPAVVGAWLARRPVLLLEPNARSGVANRWLSRLAAEAVVSLPGAAEALSCPARVTGTPVRRAFRAVPDLEAPPPGAPRVLVLGGSQGARQLNEALPGAVAALRERFEGLEVVHQCGEANAAACHEAYAAAGAAGRVRVVPFLDDVAGAMAASHLVVSRAGAVTLSEICAAGRPAVLVPLAAALGHQADNARVLTEAGAARMLEPEAVDASAVEALLGELLGSAETLLAMGRAARSLAPADAAARVADRVETLGGPGALGGRASLGGIGR